MFVRFKRPETQLSIYLDKCYPSGQAKIELALGI